MKSKFLVRLGLPALAVIFFLNSCEKIFDYMPYHHNGDAEFKKCRIIEVTDSSSSENVVQYRFFYNKHGDPDSVINNQVSTGNPNMIFKYDNRNRLVQLIRPYVNGVYESWSRYGYNEKKQIVVDTVYAFGVMTNTGPSTETPYYGYIFYEYDSEGRIAFETDSLYPYGHLEVIHNEYKYDERGNLVTFPNSTYDNKLNMRRTNNIWMFVTKDYSINNRFIADSYNEYGLPLTYHAGYEALGVIAPNGSNARVVYDCK